jgi:hypothetical protein
MSDEAQRRYLARLLFLVNLSLVLAGTCLAGLLVWFFWLRQPPQAAVPVIPGPALLPAAANEVPIPAVRFVDVTEQSGIRFRHVNGAFGKKLLPETMGSGVAFLDYDTDGHADLLLVNSCYWPGPDDKARTVPTLALYRNRGDGTFTDVTAEAGLAVTMYGMGVTAGDYDNDGRIDLFVTGVGGNRLFRNEDGKRFTDRTETAGVAGPHSMPASGGQDFLNAQAPINFSSSAAFLDFDGDSRLDLFVCNYVVWSPAFDLSQGFQLVGVGRAYGPPTAFEGTHCILYRNSGDGRFEDVSQKAGVQTFGTLHRAVGKSLGVITCDADQDGRPDIVVANDTVRNFFFHNRGDGTFQEIGEVAGVALAEGQARGAMGIDWGEYRPGRSAILIGNFADEPNTFLRLDNPKQLLFSDAALAEGIAGPSRRLLKFGAFFFDYDLDGRQDLLTCNGHLEPEINKVQAGQTYRQPAQLFWNSGGHRKASFLPVTADEAGPDLFAAIVGRGSAYADIDGDGDLDVVLTENGGPARLLRDDGGNRNRWVRLLLEGDGTVSNRSAIGARVTLEAGGVTQHREVASARGYLSQSELAVTFGVGQAEKVDRVTIRWPGTKGTTQELNNVAVNKVQRVKQP